MQQCKFLEPINLPQIPNELLATLPMEYDRYSRQVVAPGFARSDSFTDAVSDWCKSNVCDLQYGLQIIDKDIPVHTDYRVILKLFYLLHAGGSDVKTRFWNGNHTDIEEEYVISCNQWYLFRADIPHSVHNLETNQTRVSLVAKLL